MIEQQLTGLYAMSDAVELTFSEKKILIADDDFFMRGQAKLALQGLGEVIEAESGDKAVEMYQQHKPNILLLDIHMPIQGGQEVLRKILKHDPNAYIVMFSSDAIEKNVQAAKFGGAKGFVAKPFTKSDLVKYVLACPAFQTNSAVKSAQA